MGQRNAPNEVDDAPGDGKSITDDNRHLWGPKKPGALRPLKTWPTGHWSKETSGHGADQGETLADHGTKDTPDGNRHTRWEAEKAKENGKVRVIRKTTTHVVHKRKI